MEVSIPLIQNQVIDHTGTYHIVQRTINGQTGLVIEEYIPEPEPEEEVLQNNSNTRAMIIDENNNENNEENNNDNNNNNGQMVLRGQNNVRGGDDPIPDPAGEAIEGTFEINITPTPSKINIMYMSYYNSSLIELKSLNTGTSTNVTLPDGRMLVYFEETSTTYKINMQTNKSGYSLYEKVPTGAKYYISNNFNNLATVDLYDNNNEYILSAYDNGIADGISSYFNISKSIFNLILS